MLISAVMPIMSIYRLPHGQYSYSGHVINLPQDVTSFASSLPRVPSELDIVVVRKEGANQSHRDFHDFRVRRAVVHSGLLIIHKARQSRFITTLLHSDAGGRSLLFIIGACRTLALWRRVAYVQNYKWVWYCLEGRLG